MDATAWTTLLARLRLDPSEWLSQLPPSLQRQLVEHLPARPHTLPEREAEAAAAIKAVVEVVDLVPKCWPEHRALAQPDPHLRLVCKLWKHAAASVAQRPWERLELVKSPGGHGSALGQLRTPSCLAVPPSAGIVVFSDTGNNRVQIFSSDGKPERIIGGKGRDPGRFDYPVGLATDGTHLFVADNNNYFNNNHFRIQQLDLADGRYCSSAGAPGGDGTQRDYPQGLALGLALARRPADGGILLFVADYFNNRIGVFGTSPLRWIKDFGEYGDGPGQLDQPIGVATHEDEVFVADHNNHRVQVFTLDGDHLRTLGGEGAEPGRFQSPYDVAVTSSGRVLVTDIASTRVQLLTRWGAPLQVMRAPRGHTLILADDGRAYAIAQ